MDPADEEYVQVNEIENENITENEENLDKIAENLNEDAENLDESPENLNENEIQNEGINFVSENAENLVETIDLGLS